MAHSVPTKAFYSLVQLLQLNLPTSPCVPCLHLPPSVPTHLPLSPPILANSKKILEVFTEHIPHTAVADKKLYLLQTQSQV